MTPGWWVWIVLALAIAVLGLGGWKLFWGRPSGWPKVALIIAVSISALIVALAIILTLFVGFVCDWGRRGPCLP